MNKKIIFKGSGVAQITPFKNGKVDYPALERMLEFQIANKTDAVIICGTTGECSTLSDREHKKVIEFAIEKVNKRIPVIAGTGRNDTDYALELSKYAADAGADRLLLVTPYYNKASPKALYPHFMTVAEAVDCPQILYNVPSRTGCNIAISTYKELAKHPNIVAVKEATGDISATASLIAACGDDFSVYSGNDDQTVPIMALGGVGVISVLANPMPRETHEMCELMLEGKVKEAAALQLKYLDLCHALFCEVNPIPGKTAMAELGFCSSEMRLPLCEMEDKNKETLLAAMRGLNLL